MVDLDRVKQESLAWEKFANIKKLMANYYTKLEEVEKIKEAILGQIEGLKEFDVELPPLVFP